MNSERKRYSREALLSCREASAKINFEIARIPQRANRRNQKKPTPGDHEGAKSKQTVSSSEEDLIAERVDPSSTAWHRVNRHQWNPSAGVSSSYHQRQRYPSGPHGDGTEAKNVNSPSPAVDATLLRPAPDLRRGGHGDWSRGCVGWRQRSYSGSERSTVVAPNITNHFRNGRAGSGTDGDDSSMGMSRGRGRARNRYNNMMYFQQPRGSGSGVTFSKSHTGNRPMSCVGSVSSTHGTAANMSGSGEPESEFWQDDDWENIDVDDTQRTQPLDQTRSSEQKREPPVAGVPAPPPVDQLGKAVAGIRLHSKSCSGDPPPGFTLPSGPPPPTIDKHAPASEQQQQQQQQSSCQPPLESAPLLAHPPPATRWYYIDLEGQTQGPFSNQRMASWMASEFLPLAIDIRRDCDECFLSLVDHMHLAGRVPFWDGYTRPPITRAMVASITATNESRWPAPVDSSSPGHMGTTGMTPEAVSMATVLGGGDGAGAASSRTIMPCDVAITGGQLSTSQFPSAVPTVLHQQQQQQPQAPPPPLQQLPTSCCLDPAQPFRQTAGVDQHSDILRLYSEAQKLVATAAAGVQAMERQQLVDRLAVINSTAAAMLLASAPPPPPAAAPLCQLASVPLVPTHPPVDRVSGLACPYQPAENLRRASEQEGAEAARIDQTVDPSVEQSRQAPPSGLQLASGVPVTVGVEATRTGATPSVAMATGLSEEQQVVDDHEDEDVDEEEEEEVAATTTTSHSTTQAQVVKAETGAVGQTTVCSSSLPSDGIAGEPGRKSKKKKKSKKSKPSAEQDRQAAWDAEFERRRAVARERQLAQEAEQAALVAEEAAARAEEQARLASEQTRALHDQRRREAQRAKQDGQLSHLHLPMSAKWGGGASGEASSHVPAAAALLESSERSGNTSLLAIQAAQALEEAERKRQESLLAEQQAASLAAAASLASSKTRTAPWTLVVHPESKPLPTARTGPIASTATPTPATSAARTNPNTAGKPARTAVTGGQVKVAGGGAPDALSGPRTERSKPGKPLDTSTSTKSGHASSPITSIWDLPVGGGAIGSDGLGKSTKKHKKKNVHCSREAACFAAREELAHWCEAQLSSLPLPSVDLPTLVDLLCELEAADQVVEFIETSLGRSKQITEFSKAFLQKRACMLKAMH